MQTPLAIDPLRLQVDYVSVMTTFWRCHCSIKMTRYSRSSFLSILRRAAKNQANVAYFLAHWSSTNQIRPQSRQPSHPSSWQIVWYLHIICVCRPNPFSPPANWETAHYARRHWRRRRIMEGKIVGRSVGRETGKPGKPGDSETRRWRKKPWHS